MKKTLVIFTLPETNISLANGLWDGLFSGGYISFREGRLYRGLYDPVIYRDCTKP